MTPLRLKPGKEYPIKAGHPWIFSNAIDLEPPCEPGDLIEVESFSGQKLGIGMINPSNSIRVRMLCREHGTPITAEFFAERLAQLDTQKKPFLPPKTTGYRICHSDADGLPGLVVDRYSKALVFQISTAGMERLKDKVVEALKKTFHPTLIVERSDLESRSQEGLKSLPAKIHHGHYDQPIEFMENGVRFLVDPMTGQKTGFFLDQRNARIKAHGLSEGKKVLNLYGYTGAFSVHAALGGATEVTTVDLSKSALDLAKQNLEANGFDSSDATKFQFLEADVATLFKNKAFKESYDLIVCDPPAFAKSERSVANALEAYQQLNQRCLWMLKEGGILITSSCSGRVSAEEFRKILKMAAGHTGRDVKLLDFMEQASDHTEKISFPEGRYLKTAILEVIRAVSEAA
jgi:23S rRNA (cytosine1962-C5)-methyltransferase